MLVSKVLMTRRLCAAMYSCMVPRGGGPKRCVGPADEQTDPVPCSAIATTAAPEHNCYQRGVERREEGGAAAQGHLHATTTTAP